MSKDSKDKVQYFVVYDLETGGFSEKEHAITEIAIVVINGSTLEEHTRYSTFVKPYGNLTYSKEALSITGITMEMIESGKSSEVVVSEVDKLLKSLSGGRNKKPILCGHNIISFDNKFLRHLFSLHKFELDKLINTDIYFDTMWFSRMKTPVDRDTIGTHKLVDACKREGIELVNAHRAINDTAANAELVVSYLKNLRGEGEVIEEVVEPPVRETFKF